MEAPPDALARDDNDGPSSSVALRAAKDITFGSVRRPLRCL
jgi:hypothetical protein